jgi:tetratricopeptide (TPR) repeat protein
MLKRFVHQVVWFLLAVCAALPVAVQERSPDWTQCEDAFSPDVEIGGCTAVIQSSRETAADRATAYHLRGVAYRDKGDMDRAIADFSEAIRLNPRLASAYRDRGVAYRAKGDHGRAVADQERATQLDPIYGHASK